jgi:uncharacterized membrane protein
MAAKAQQKIEQTLKVKVPAEDVCSLIENVARTPEWNPLVKEIRLGEGDGRGIGSTVEWKAELAGITISGTSVTTTWKPGKEYAWRNTEQATGLSLEGRFIVRPAGGQTAVTATVSFSLPKAATPLLNLTGSKTLFTAAVRKALQNIVKAAAPRK